MTIDKPSLAEQRQSIRMQLQVQRQVVAQRLTPAAATGGSYPRSLTMRFLIQRPELLARLLKLIVGARFAGSVAPLLALLHMLPSIVDLSHRRPVAIARIEQDETASP